MSSMTSAHVIMQSKLLEYVQALHSWNSVLTLYFCFWHFIIIKTFKESLCYIYVA